jgi:hypothetical protein
VIYLILWYFRRFVAGFMAGYHGMPLKGRARSQPSQPVRTSQKSSAMVRCESCGTFVTEGRAMIVGGRKFCSAACMEQKARLIKTRPLA